MYMFLNFGKIDFFLWILVIVVIVVVEHLADKMGEWAREAREIAAKQRRRAATRRLQTSRRKLQPHDTRSEVGWRWQRETPVGGLQQGEPKKGGRPPFFPREGIG